MGLNIGGLLKDVGINLPKIDLGNIGKTVLDEGKKLLGEVVKDSFTLSSKPGETFADDMNLNVLGDNIRLPNPVGALANKLLGKADDFLGQYGVNIDFKTALGKLFNLPTEAGDTTVPSVKDRATTGDLTAAGAAATGGGAVVASDAVAAAAGANATGGADAPAASNTASTPTSTAAVNTTLDSGMTTALNQAGQSLSAAEDALKSAGDDPAKLQAAAAQMQKANEMFSIISQIIADNHQTRMQMISNMAK
jgi:hypothetical protein